MKEIYKKILGMIDLTSLNATDTRTSVRAMVEKVNNFNNVFPDYPKPASICIFPNFAGVVEATRKSKDIRITVVGGCFPASQSPLKVKVLECTEAVTDGADEVDIVLALNSFLDGRPEEAAREIYEINKAVKAINSDVHLKVILETGALKEASQIEQASMLAMEAGADFIKTSTGKISPAATPEAAQIMCQAIAKYYKKSGRKVGFKPAGGISMPEEALVYYNIVRDTLGSEWLTPALFRFGASRMANNILSALEEKEIKYF